MAYHMLFQREPGEAWTPQFGDRDRDCVEFERDEYKANGAKARDLKIVKFPRVPSQKQVNAKRDEMNGANP